MADLRASKAIAGELTGGQVLVSIVPMGFLGSPPQPFKGKEQKMKVLLWAFLEDFGKIVEEGVEKENLGVSRSKKRVMQ